MDVKACKNCGLEKSLKDFYVRWDGGHYAWCRPCHVGRTSARKSRLPKEIRAGYNVKRNGISEEQYQVMHQLQEGVCAICGRPEPVSGRRLAVDHDHQSGKIRDLLCSACNRGLGHFYDRPELLVSAANYLNTHRTDIPVETKERVITVPLTLPTADAILKED